MWGCQHTPAANPAHVSGGRRENEQHRPHGVEPAELRCTDNMLAHRHNIVQAWAQPSTGDDSCCGVARVVVDLLARACPDGPGRQGRRQLLERRLHPVHMAACADTDRHNA